MFLKKLEIRPPIVLLRRMIAVRSGFFGRISPSAAARTRRSATARDVSGRFSGFGEHISESTYATAAETSGRIVRTSGSASPFIAFARSPMTVLPSFRRLPCYAPTGTPPPVRPAPAKDVRDLPGYWTMP